MASDPRRTPGVVLMEAHWKDIGLDEGWDNQKLNRCCRFLNWTPWELGASAAVDLKTMQRCMTANRFPPYIALHFALRQALFIELKLGTKQPPLVPLDLMDYRL